MRKFLLPAVAALLAGACSSAPPTQDQVATLSSPAASSAPAKNTTRPQLRLDTSDEEAQRYWTAYDDCLVANGVKVNVVDQAGPAGNDVRRLDQSGEPRSAYKACAGKLPLQPPELDEDINPHYASQWNDNVRCLREHGLMVHVTNPGEWTYDDGDNPLPANQDELEESCLLEAFGGKK
ncbi:hypothetical protein JIG36_02530 [Actinoplanes sp. LDG1-06]|uniref:Lipoprotein n=1 Tax=Paractinoplanes ovalisporus TaxID=2810368 RepID=A0ABS2A561_9ACTN|nr:hypothetical protein [Actinoplanes ovalisporus]MBM2614434.1 hypothetical protein [Actinoplanes ovalisporus]